MDPQALFERHHQKIYRFFLRMGGGQSTAEDLCQEVFLRALRAWGRFRPKAGGGELAWLFRIARNLWIDRHRRGAHHMAEEVVEHPSSQPPIELSLQLQQALDTLGVGEREAFLLREIGGLSYREAADLTDSTEAAVRPRIYRARRSLRMQLEGRAPKTTTSKEEAAR